MEQSTTDGEYSPVSPKSESTLLALKRARKQIESDAQLLANRIALLKQEELKSWKKIEETKKKAREIYLLKKKNEDKLQEKQIKEMMSGSEIKDVQTSLTAARKNKEKEKQEMLQSIYQQKFTSATAQKKQSLKNDLKKVEFKEKVVEVNQHKSQKVKEQEVLVVLKKQEAQANKLVQNRVDYEKRMAEEETLKRKKETEVLNMEKLEMELIRKLQNTQSLQKTAYEELEQALAQSPTQYAQKYLKNGEASPGHDSPFRSSFAREKQRGNDGEEEETGGNNQKGGEVSNE